MTQGRTNPSPLITTNTPPPPIHHHQCQQAETILSTNTKTVESLAQTIAVLQETKNLLTQQRADYYERSREAVLAHDSKLLSLRESMERLQMEAEELDREKTSWKMKALSYKSVISRKEEEITYWKRIACKYQKDQSPVSTGIRSRSARLEVIFSSYVSHVPASSTVIVDYV